MRFATLAALALMAAPAAGASTGPPLPKAPVRVVIEDPAAFDAVLTGAFRRVLVGRPQDGDPVVAGWRRTRVGTKLEEQWAKLSADLPWTWDSIRRLQPRSVGIALLEAGHLEAVLAIDTPLARLPVRPRAGKPKTHGGVAYQLVKPGAADGSEDGDRRMGLAWARLGSVLLLATSERALRLSIDESLAGRGFAAPLPGLISLELDLDALRKDRYFRREFLFGQGPEQGIVRAALRLEGGRLVEVREGEGEAGAAAMVFDAPGAAASGWEPDGSTVGPALRAALLEPIPTPSDRPVPPLAALPAAAAQAAEDRYLTNFERPLVRGAAAAWEEGELAQWRALWHDAAVPGWGYAIEPDGVRRIVFAWPAARDGELVGLCRATVERRAGRATVGEVGDSREISVGPSLPAIAVRRTGAYVWIAPSAHDLERVAEPRPAGDVVRWGRVDLRALRAEAPRWEKAEGPAAPEQTRPLSDRVLGLLGWMPQTATLAVERRRTGAGWSETIVFGAE
jgi:hypothetical protein